MEEVRERGGLREVEEGELVEEEREEEGEEVVEREEEGERKL